MMRTAHHSVCVNKGAGVDYPHNELDGFQNGCNMDLRARIALNLLQHSPIFHRMLPDNPQGFGLIPKEMVTAACDLAEELLRQSKERGWIEAFPADGELTDRLREQGKRAATFSAVQQIEGAKAMHNEQARVVPVAPGFVGKPN